MRNLTIGLNGFNNLSSLRIIRKIESTGSGFDSSWLYWQPAEAGFIETVKLAPDRQRQFLLHRHADISAPE